MKRRNFLRDVTLAAILTPTLMSGDKKQDDLDKKVNQIISEMTPEQKAAQMIISYPINPTNAKKYGLGGIILNQYFIRSEKKVRELIGDYKDIVIPLFICVDQEGGYINRLKYIKNFAGAPSALEMGDKWSLPRIYEYQKNIANFMKDVGINVNLAPCLDISPHSRAIMRRIKRTFGETPEKVVRNAEAFSQAYKNKNIVLVGKHFPGYGNVIVNTDTDIGKSNISKEELIKQMSVYNEMRPYLTGIMMSHVVYQLIDDVPASLSSKLVNYARNIIGEKGLIVSDDICTHGVLNFTTLENAIDKAILAGNDLFITMNDRKLIKIINHIEDRYNKNSNYRREINNSVHRILAVKQRLYSK